MNSILVELALIDDRERLRPVDTDWAQILAASIGERGLDTPVQLGEPDIGGRYRLVAGAHRVAAFRLLGRTSIPAVIVHGDELMLRLAEIDENLMRRELTELDRAIFLLERKRVYEALHPETTHGGKRASKKSKSTNVSTWSERFTAASAAKLACNERGIQRTIRRAEKLPPDVRALLQSTRSADIGRELDQLARLTPEVQRRVAALIAQRGCTVGGALDALEARKAPRPDTADAQHEALMRAWMRASAAARSRFLGVVGLVMVPKETP